MQFRPATAGEIDQIMTVIEDGRTALGKLGIDQWQGITPNAETIGADIAAGYTMVATEGDAILGTLAFVDVEEADYSNVTSGSWLLDRENEFKDSPSSVMDTSAGASSNESGMESADASSAECPYITLHRVAVASNATGKGVAKFMIRSSIEMARAMGKQSLRVDTHEGNLPMQHVLERCGFAHCCNIRITLPAELTKKRLGYELLLR